jgi:predicted acetyltransferase
MSPSPAAPPMRLVRPAQTHLESYADALARGWSPDTTRPQAAQDELEAIARDPEGFLALMENREGGGPPVQLPDGSQAQRLPSLRRWMWDGAFCGSISLRWQPGTAALPPHCLGHIGYAVVPWRRRQGFATQALRDLLPEAWALGLPFVELTTDPDNLASQRVIEANGGALVARFHKPPQYGGAPGLRYRISHDPGQ